MERKREATRVLLGEGLKELMKSHHFEKIKVKLLFICMERDRGFYRK